jgi:hypothetical protein
VFAILTKRPSTAGSPLHDLSTDSGSNPLRLWPAVASHRQSSMTFSSFVSRTIYVLCTSIACLVSAHSVHAQQLPAADFDTSIALGSRIVEAPASVIQRFVDAHLPAPVRHTLTAAERSKVVNALNALPPLPRRALTQRLRSISFLDGILVCPTPAGSKPSTSFRARRRCR